MILMGNVDCTHVHIDIDGFLYGCGFPWYTLGSESGIPWYIPSGEFEDGDNMQLVVVSCFSPLDESHGSTIVL